MGGGGLSDIVIVAHTIVPFSSSWNGQLRCNVCYVHVLCKRDEQFGNRPLLVRVLLRLLGVSCFTMIICLCNLICL